ncbi:MAG: CBS domain-containing protein [Proteobacteria bacterium]|nr:CBS domain-containing protein [Pseudomonadota bacterium]
MRVRDIMTENPLTVDSETSIFDAKKIMKENNIRRLPVVDKGKLVGMVTERMILEASPSPATSLSIHELHYLISKMKVKEIMVKNPITISPDTTFEEALLLGQEKRIGAFPVVDKEKLVGITTESDLVRFIASIWGAKEKASTIIVEGISQRFGLFKEIVSIVDRHEIPMLSMMTYIAPGRVDCCLIIRVKTKEVGSLVTDLKKAKFKVIYWE